MFWYVIQADPTVVSTTAAAGLITFYQLTFSAGMLLLKAHEHSWERLSARLSRMLFLAYLHMI